MQNISICLLSSSRVLTLCRASMKQGAWEVAVPTLFVWGKSNVHIKPYCTRLLRLKVFLLSDCVYSLQKGKRMETQKLVTLNREQNFSR